MPRRLPLVVNLVAFAIVAVFVHSGLRYGYFRHVMAAKRGCLIREKEFARSNDEVSFAFFGNSHVMMGLAPRLIPDSVGFATLGEGYMVTYGKLREMLDHRKPQVRAIAMQLDLHSFGASQIDQTGQPYWAQYADFPRLAADTTRTVPVLMDWLRYKEFPYVGSLSVIAKTLSQDDQLVRDRQVEILTGDFSKHEDKQGLTMLRLHEHVPEGSWYCEESAAYLRRCLRFCRDHGIRVVLIRFPLTRIYWENVFRFIPIDKWEAKTREILADFPEVIVWDYHDVFFDHEEYFTDPNHLNVTGAEIFSKMVRDRFVELEKTLTSGNSPDSPPPVTDFGGRRRSPDR